MHKIIIVLLFVLKNQTHADYLDRHEEECVEETGISEEVVFEAKREHVVFGDSEKYKEYLSCCWKKYGYQRSNGDIAWENIRIVLEKAYKPKIVVKLINKCIDVEGKTPGDTVVLLLRCLDDHAPNLHNLHHHYTGHHS